MQAELEFFGIVYMLILLEIFNDTGDFGKVADPECLEEGREPLLLTQALRPVPFASIEANIHGVYTKCHWYCAVRWFLAE